MPTWNQKRRTMRLYNQSAHVYDTQYLEEQEAKIATAEENMSLKDNHMVLDVGCGTGLLISHFAYKSKFFVGVDISRGLLDYAKQRAKLFSNSALVLADADTLPFPNQVFDAVFAVTLIQNMPDPSATLTEIRRVSKAKASIVVTGLRKRFTQEDLVEKLQQANMQTKMLKLDAGDREYICICHKKRR